MAEDAVTWHVSGAVGHIVLNRPEAGNAINLALARAFRAAVAAAAGAGVRSVMVSANGPRFCVGGDIRAFADDTAAMGDLIRV